jgi:aminopeptidase N
MEHAGASFLREDSVLFPSDPSDYDHMRRANLIFHETSHQWFGDLVTMRWFDDLWLKEGFANYMAAKASAALLPQYPAWNAFHALKTSAYRTDVTRGTTAIYQPIPNLASAKSAYGNIVYSKAPAILKQAEFSLGEAVFERALRDFVRRHAYGAAQWSDLVRAFERASGKNLQRWADAWVKRRGMPAVRLAWQPDRHGALERLSLAQQDVLGEGGLWPMRVKVMAQTMPDDKRAGESRSVEVTLDGRHAASSCSTGAAAKRCSISPASLATTCCARCCSMRCGKRCARPSLRPPITSTW